MASNYTAWPIKADIDLTLSVAGITARAAATSGYYTALINATVAKLTQQTKRQFLKGSAGEIRYFDGSGTGIQVVDEFASFTDISILGFASTPASLSITNATAENVNLYPRTEIFIFRGSLPALGRIWLDSFPVGRGNIQVTATWGYDYIPEDVWEAVRRCVAAQLAEETMFNSSGRLKRWMELDTMEDRDLNLPGEALGWYQSFKQAIYDHRKPTRQYLDRAKPRMI